MLKKYNFLWHDYETFGIIPKYTKPSQFAAIITNKNLNKIYNYFIIYCRPTFDFIPNLYSCLITKITPKICLKKGIYEYEFAKKINKYMSKPFTINTGYNNINFDDEITRFLFWRNLISPYNREWKNNCSKWDFINILRIIYIFKPNYILWNKYNSNLLNLKLKKISTLNGLKNINYHNALNDVKALLFIAKIINNKNSKLFNFLLSLRKKKNILKEINLKKKKPFIYITNIFQKTNYCLSIMIPLIINPININELIAINLNFNLYNILKINNKIILNYINKYKKYLYLQKIYLNKMPIVINNLNLLNKKRAKILNININKIINNFKIIKKILNFKKILKYLKKKYILNYKYKKYDIDQDLYKKFLNKKDILLLNKIKKKKITKYINKKINFKDYRLKELFFRFCSRNFFNLLSFKKKKKWKKFCEINLLKNKYKIYNIYEIFLEINLLIKKIFYKEYKIFFSIYQYIKKISFFFLNINQFYLFKK